MRSGQPEDHRVDGGWHDAVSVSEGQPSAHAQQQQRTSRNRRIALLIAVGLFPLAVVGGLLVAGGSLPELARSERPEYVQNAGLVLSSVGFALTILGVVRLIRAGMWGQAWRAPELSLTRPERRRLLAQIRRGEPVPDDRRSVAVDLAHRLARQLPVVLVYGGLVLNWTGQALGSSAVFLRWLHAALVIVGLAFLLVMHRDIRRGRRWLELYAPGAPSA